MRYKWGEKELRYFTNPIPVVVRESWLSKFIDRYFWWIAIAVMTSAIVWVWWEIYELYQIRQFIETLN